jgi:hypothetical protein
MEIGFLCADCEAAATRAERCGTTVSALRRCAVSVNAKVNIAIAQRPPVVVFTTKRFVGWDIPPPFFRMDDEFVCASSRVSSRDLGRDRRKFEVGSIFSRRTVDDIEDEKCSDGDD